MAAFVSPYLVIRGERRAVILFFAFPDRETMHPIYFERKGQDLQFAPTQALQ